MNLNKVMLIGNLTRDPEVKSTPGGQTVATFSLATNLVWTDQSGQKREKAEFHNIVVWRRLADICGQYLRKGSKVYIEGRLQTRDWTGQDGVKRYRTEVVAENMIMLDRQGGNQFGQNNSTPSAPSDDSFIPSEEPNYNTSSTDEEEIRVENIPF